MDFGPELNVTQHLSTDEYRVCFITHPDDLPQGYKISSSGEILGANPIRIPEEPGDALPRAPFGKALTPIERRRG